MDLQPSRPAADRIGADGSKTVGTAEDRLSGGGSGGRHSHRVEFSARGPRLRLTGVVIQNQGIDWNHPGNVYWQHKVGRYFELLNIHAWCDWRTTCFG